MEPFHEFVDEYKEQMAKGAIQKAYKGLMEYVMALRTHFQNKYPDYFVSGSIYYGYMDMTYFSIVPESMKSRKLKIALVFLHDSCRFEVWLAGANKQVQSQYWKLFRQSDWSKYRVVSTLPGADSIVEHVVASDPDFCDLDALTKQIERGTANFILDLENFLSKHERGS